MARDLRALCLSLLLGVACNASPLTGACSDCCQSDGDCATGLYCGPTGECVAECGREGKLCPTGQRCTAAGRCLPEDQVDGGSCASISVRLTPVVPRVLLLIDQSGSMTDPFGQANGKDVNRWEAVHYALTDPKVGAVTSLQARVQFGATLYHSQGGNQGGVCPILTSSAGAAPGRPQLNNRDAIDSLFVKNAPDRDTPTAESVRAITADQGLWGNDAGPRVLVLATDGDPDTCVDPNASGAGPQGLSEQAVQAAYAAGIRTYVLSVGAQVTKAHLERLANAGAGKPLAPAAEPFFLGNNPADLVSAFNTIIRGSRSCRLALNGKADAAAAGQAKVSLNGNPLGYGKDWQLRDPQTIDLLGAACSAFLAADVVDLKADFPCGSVIIIG